MRLKIMLVLAVLSGAILAWNLHTMFLRVPDELNQGAIFRIIYFHVPAAITSFTGFFFAMFASVAYLASKDLRFDAIAASINEVSLAFATITLITGSMWGRIAWGIWWTWDARLTSYFVCWLLYVGYLMLRRAIDDPTTRARLVRGVVYFRLRRYRDRVEIDRMVPDAASRAGAEHSQWRRHGAGNGSAHLVELAGVVDALARF